MIALSPKLQFQQQETASKSFRTVANSSDFQTALAFALAEFAHTRGPTTEQLNGARSFVGTLLNLCERDEPQRAMKFTSIDHINPDTKTK
jgi:hypothetical protein